jgi:lactate/malate dehydrogenase, NAD binding domain
MTKNAEATGFDTGVQMKVGIVGTAAVGAATGLALVQRRVCRDIVLIDRDPALAAGVALDLRYASALSRAVDVWSSGQGIRLNDYGYPVCHRCRWRAVMLGVSVDDFGGPRRHALPHDGGKPEKSHSCCSREWLRGTDESADRG